MWVCCFCRNYVFLFFFFFSSRRRHTRFKCDWSSDVCSSDLNACRKAEGEQPLGLDEARGQGLIEYAPFPEALKGKYQNFTQADVGALRRAGFAAPFLPVEEGVERYCRQMLDERKAAGG